MVINSADASRSRATMASLLTTPESRSLHALRARAHWGLGVAAARASRFDEAFARYDSARAEYSAAHERVNEDATHFLTGESQFFVGDASAGAFELHAAIQRLQRSPPSQFLHNSLYVFARFAEGEGYRRTARLIAEEDVRAAPEMDSTRNLRAFYLVESRLGLARVIAPSPDSVAFALADAPELLPRISIVGVRAVLGQQIAVARARGLVRVDPRAADSALLAPIDFHRRTHQSSRLLTALLLRAEARASLSREDSAAADLDEAARLLESDHTVVSGEWHRATVMAQARAIRSRLVLARANRGDGVGALAQLERARRSFGRSTATAPTPLRMPRGSVALTHALIGDTLLTWTTDEREVVMRRDTVSGANLLAAITEARTALERRDDARAVRLLDQLHALFVAPVASRLPVGATLVTAEDGELAGLPYAAFRDARRGRWLIEDHVLVSEASIRDAIESHSEPSKRFGSVPALFVTAESTSTRWLPGASDEITQIAARYHKALLLRRATPEQLATAIANYGVVHIATHSVSDAVRPERSFLQLTPGDSSDRLDATTLGRLGLRHVRLAVLAACRSMAAEPDANAYRGLGDALRGAGAKGVLGSLWQIDDGLTHELMIRLHDDLARSTDAATALAAAQKEMLRSGDARLASPSAWSGFQYAGAWSSTSITNTSIGR